MRAMPSNDSLGCKGGRIWKQVGNDDFVDVGPVTDSCNCNVKMRQFSGRPISMDTLQKAMDSAMKIGGIVRCDTNGNITIVPPPQSGTVFIGETTTDTIRDKKGRITAIIHDN